MIRNLEALRALAAWMVVAHHLRDHLGRVWTPLGEHWAEVTSRAGSARAEAGVPVSAVGYRIVVRGSPPGSASRPLPGQRFREGPRVFSVIAVAERDGAGMYLTCFAEEETVT